MTAAGRRRLEETRPARRVVSDPISGRRIDVSRHAPPAALAGWIDRFWGTRWDLRRQPAHEAAMIGDPTIHLVIEAGSSRLVGVHRRRFVRRLHGRGRILGTQLHPGAILGLRPEPASVWTDRIVPLGSVLALDVIALERLALAHDDDAEAFAVIARQLAPLLRPLDESATLARAIVEHVARTPGLVRVAPLEREAGLDERSLQRLFRRCIGVTPKWVIRRVRLQEAAARLELEPDRSLAALAGSLGYADQAHFARDFRAVIGSAPRSFAARLQAARGPGR